MRERLINTLPPAEKVPESLGIPFTRVVRDVLERTAQEAATLGSAEVRPEHLVLALLSDEAGSIGPLLTRGRHHA
jgi:ATP-dependent Clp protease ATP-binding subunit ClpA